MSSFFDNHVHTHYSNIRLLDSINRPKNIIDKAIELGLEGIAITDHECISSHMEVNQYSKEIKEKYPNFKIALGNEIYLVDKRENGIKYYHFILIAKDEIGHKQLRKLSSKAWLNSYFDRGLERVPLLKEELKEIIGNEKGHLIATTACLGGEIGSCLLMIQECEDVFDNINAHRYYLQIHNFIEFCKEMFNDDFYIEVAPAKSNDQIMVNKKLLTIANNFNIKLCIGSDSHYPTKEDRYVHKAYLNSKGGEREVDSFYEYAHLMSADEARENLKASFDDPAITEIFNNSLEIKSKIKDYSLEHKQIIPKVEVIDYEKTSIPSEWFEKYPVICELIRSDEIQERYWINECIKGLQEKDLYNDKYLARLEIEADIIKHIGGELDDCLFAYFNTFKHYIDLFWECGSIVGPGRGSATGFLSNYLLGITQLNPVRWGLPYWRFLFKARANLPDIDIDLASEKRPLIIKKIREERGELGLVQVATFGTEGTKSAILTACFKKGQLVLTKTGKKPIEELTQTDYVYTTDGWQKINELTYLNNKEIVKLNNKNSTDKEIYCTSDHEFLIVSKENKGRIAGKFNKTILQNIWTEFSQLKSTDKLYQRYYGYFRDVEPIWKSASEITQNDYGLRKIDLTINSCSELHWSNSMLRNFGTGISETIPINNDFCELLGIYLAEGSSNGNSITFTINKNEIALKNRIIKLMWNVFQLNNVTIYERKDSQALNISYTSRQLIDFFEQLFKTDNIQNITQWNKFVPEIMRYINPSLQLQIFKGWFLGDGYARTSKNGIRQSDEAKGTTVSKQLADDIIFILNRNFINPTVIIDKRNNRTDAYNIMLYSDKARILYQYKYESDNFDKELIIPFEARYNLDIPVIYNNNFYLRTTLELDNEYKEDSQTVYCIQVDSQNFTLGDTIVHNCRGYRSDEYPDGIDVDQAQYMSALIPQERGMLWDIKDVVYGNPDKNRKPVSSFIREVNYFPGLLDIIIQIVGLINKRSSHASGIILYDEDPYKTASFMRTPKGEIITCYNLHDAEAAGDTKYDFLITEISDKIIHALDMLAENGEIENLSLRERYNKYIHPEVLDTTDPLIWEHLAAGDILDVFQFNSGAGLAIAKKLKPKNPVEMTAANAISNIVAIHFTC